MKYGGFEGRAIRKDTLYFTMLRSNNDKSLGTYQTNKESTKVETSKLEENDLYPQRNTKPQGQREKTSHKLAKKVNTNP